MFASGDSLVCFFALFPKAKCLSLCLTNSPWHIPPIHLTTNTSQKELIPRTAVQREFAREETIGHFQYYNFLVSCLLCKVVLRSLKKFVLCRSNQANTKEMKEETGYVCRAADVISWGMGRASKHSGNRHGEKVWWVNRKEEELNDYVTFLRQWLIQLLYKQVEHCNNKLLATHPDLDNFRICRLQSYPDKKFWMFCQFTHYTAVLAIFTLLPSL